MKKLFLYILLISPLLLFSEEFNSVEKLKAFMEEGQKNGYFPKKILLENYMGKDKLIEVDIEFRTIIHWDIHTKCPTTEDEIILALGSQSHSIICHQGDTAGILGSGNDWVKDSTGNDIYYPGAGDDTLDMGSGNDILIFNSRWGHDKVTVRSQKVNTKKIMGYDGSYPWRYSDFIIFGEDVKRENIVWQGKKLVDLSTGDSIQLNTKEINILFASDPKNNLLPVPSQKTVDLKNLRSESALVQGKYLYLAKGNEGLWIIDISKPSNPVLLSQQILPGRAMDLVISDNIAYVAQGDQYLSGKRGWVSIVDIHNKSAPKLLKTLKYGNALRTIAVNNKTLYVSDTHFSKSNKRALHIYDVSDPAAPSLLSSTKLKTYARDMRYLDHKLYFRGKHQKLKIMDVRDPKYPAMLTSHPLNDTRVYNIKVKDKLLVLTHKGHKMSLYRLQNDGTLKKFCALTTAENSKMMDYSHVNRMEISQNYIYKAESADGISVVDIGNCKVVNRIPIQNKKWVTALVKVDQELVNFYTMDKGNIYYLQADQIHEEKIPPYMQKRMKQVNALPALSKDQLQTLLYKAAVSDKVKEVKRLCELGANPNIRGHEKATPVEIAARLGRIKALRTLLENGGIATKKSMFLAALTEKNEAMKLLEKKGVPVTVRGKSGCTTLHYIAQDGTLDMVKYLIKKGVPYDAACRKGETPLTWANYGTNCPVIEYLETLYPASYRKKSNEKCETLKLKEQIKKINKRIEELNRKSEHLKRERTSKQQPSIFDLGTNPLNIKLKAKQKEEILRVKCLVAHPMITEYVAEKRGLHVSYVKHMTFRVGNKIVFDMSNSPYLSKNPIVKFKARNNNTDEKLTLVVTDNSDTVKSKSVKIKGESVGNSFIQEKGKVIDFHRTHPKIWTEKTVKDAAKALYGDVQYQEGDIKIFLPKLVADSGSIPIGISSDMDFESIAILSNTTERPVIAVFSVPKGLKVNYRLKFKAKNYEDEYVLVIAKGRDGKYYKAIQKFEISHGGDNCS